MIGGLDVCRCVTVSSTMSTNLLFVQSPALILRQLARRLQREFCQGNPTLRVVEPMPNRTPFTNLLSQYNVGVLCELPNHRIDGRLHPLYQLLQLADGVSNMPNHYCVSQKPCIAALHIPHTRRTPC